MVGGYSSVAAEYYPSDMRIHVPATGFYTYPDASAERGEQHFVKGQTDTPLNPSLHADLYSRRPDGRWLLTSALLIAAGNPDAEGAPVWRRVSEDERLNVRFSSIRIAFHGTASLRSALKRPQRPPCRIILFQLTRLIVT